MTLKVDIRQVIHAFSIMDGMVNRGHLDPEIVELVKAHSEECRRYAG